MATLVCFHAHPDDEAIATGGVMAAAAAAGHRVVAVWATRGEHGEVQDGFLDPGESLTSRREKEAQAAAEVLGVSVVEFLGYVDSGMIGTPENDRPESFWQADVEEAAERLAAILRREAADVLTIYDSNGGYGHPDHIQVHRVGLRAAALAGTARVYESSINREHLIEGIRRGGGEAPEGAPDFENDDSFGMPAAAFTTAVDVSAFLEQKKAAMRVHASQIPPDSFFLAMPDDVFAWSFGTEWFIRRGVPTPVEALETSLF
jgi:LmbE family N-acetylglucosaminyl deacetylase